MSRIIFDGESLIILKPQVMTSSLLYHNFLSAARTLKYNGIRMFSWKFAYNTKLIYVSTDMWSKGHSIINV